MAEHSHAERPPLRVELSTQELALLLGADRFEAPEMPALPFEPENPAPADAVQPPTGGQRAMGDADLVHALLEGSEDFQSLLLLVIRERLGEPMVRIVDGAVADAMIASGTASPVGDQRALAAPLSPDVRAAWAAWFMRWNSLAALVALRAPKGAWDDPTGLPVWSRIRAHAAHRIAGARARKEPVFVSVLRIVDTDLWNRRAQVLINDPFLARVAAALDHRIAPGDELARLEDGAFVLVSSRAEAATDLADALRTEIAALPGDGPRSLAVRVGTATAPWDATCPNALLEHAVQAAAAQ